MHPWTHCNLRSTAAIHPPPCPPGCSGRQGGGRHGPDPPLRSQRAGELAAELAAEAAAYAAALEGGSAATVSAEGRHGGTAPWPAAPPLTHTCPPRAPVAACAQTDSSALSSDGLQSALDDYRRACWEAAAAVRGHLRKLAERLQVRGPLAGQRAEGANSLGLQRLLQRLSPTIWRLAFRRADDYGPALHGARPCRRAKWSWYVRPQWAWLPRRWRRTRVRRYGAGEGGACAALLGLARCPEPQRCPSHCAILAVCDVNSMPSAACALQPRLAPAHAAVCRRGGGGGRRGCGRRGGCARQWWRPF